MSKIQLGCIAQVLTFYSYNMYQFIISEVSKKDSETKKPPLCTREDLL